MIIVQQFTLHLKNTTQRPIITLEGRIDAMIDTGSLFPIWVKDEKLLIKLGGKLIKSNVSFTGFGGSTFGNLYELDLLKIGKLIYPKFHIITCIASLPCYMILSATMFSGLLYEIDDHNHKFNISIPDTQSAVRNLVIKETNGTLHVLCIYNADMNVF